MTSYTTNALNTRDFLSSPGRDNMGEIRIVGPNKIRDILIRYARNVGLVLYRVGVESA